METKAYYTYIVRCSDDSLYTGYTTNLKKRLHEHNEGKNGAKYTRSRRPVTLVYFEKHDTKHDAMSREALIKQLSRRQKDKLIEGQEKEKQ
ncbi:MAG: GIY-YIG nuclease family protein [Lachnospiraceae bacterium]|jgi:putative endonuclease|nr:GIY-YIG nuclease family protein [Lachnospiraceae bacterium]MDD5956503.1 GIY-YIG nuclease family protein [Lachnospiraceae bacterium]MDY3990991.1 GIY-YIG nuclease family protein [Lachnospiraceae bacterium]